MKKQGYLKTGTSGSLTWSRGGEPTGNIRYRVEQRGMRLIYRTRPYGQDDWSNVDEVIPFVHTETNFSGRRQWFQCPSCQRRCRIVYGGSLFRCRICHDLKYETQYEPAFARSASKALNIRRKLGDRGGVSDPFPDKPKGMHWRTYRRLERIYYRLCDQWSAGIMQKWKIGER